MPLKCLHPPPPLPVQSAKVKAEALFIIATYTETFQCLLICLFFLHREMAPFPAQTVYSGVSAEDYPEQREHFRRKKHTDWEYFKHVFPILRAPQRCFD